MLTTKTPEKEKIIPIFRISLSCRRVDVDENARPANLENSAVLKFLKEEEQKQAQQAQSGKFQ